MDITTCNDFLIDLCGFAGNNVRHYYSIIQYGPTICKLCSITCGVKFIFNSTYNTRSLWLDDECICVKISKI